MVYVWPGRQERRSSGRADPAVPRQNHPTVYSPRRPANRRGYTCEAAALTASDQPPLFPSRARANTYYGANVVNKFGNAQFLLPFDNVS